MLCLLFYTLLSLSHTLLLSLTHSYTIYNCSSVPTGMDWFPPHNFSSILLLPSFFLSFWSLYFCNRKPLCNMRNLAQCTSPVCYLQGPIFVSSIIIFTITMFVTFMFVSIIQLFNLSSIAWLIQCTLWIVS